MYGMGHEQMDVWREISIVLNLVHQSVHGNVNKQNHRGTDRSTRVGEREGERRNRTLRRFAGLEVEGPYVSRFVPLCWVDMMWPCGCTSALVNFSISFA